MAPTCIIGWIIYKKTQTGPRFYCLLQTEEKAEEEVRLLKEDVRLLERGEEWIVASVLFVGSGLAQFDQNGPPPTTINYVH